MNKQTENYIILKPLAERFNKVAASITDEDIKHIIMYELSEQIRNSCNFGSTINYILDEWLESNVETINGMIKKSIENKFR